MTEYGDKELSEKISQLHPEISACGMAMHVTYEKREQSWVVHLKKGIHCLDHFLDLMDADMCIGGKQCASLGLEIAQLQSNIEAKAHEPTRY
jgi:hypothetical protein